MVDARWRSTEGWVAPQPGGHGSRRLWTLVVGVALPLFLLGIASSLISAWNAVQALPASQQVEHGYALARQGRWADAVVAYTKAIELDPTSANVLVLRGMAKAESGDAVGGTADSNEALWVATEPFVISYVKMMRCNAGLGCE